MWRTTKIANLTLMRMRNNSVNFHVEVILLILVNVKVADFVTFHAHLFHVLSLVDECFELLAYVFFQAKST